MWLLVAAPLACVAVASCGEDAGGSNFGGVDGSIDPSLDGAASPDANVDAAATSAAFRLAHLSPDVGRIDVCYRTSPSEAFTGPLLLGVPAPDAGVADAAPAPMVDAAGDAGDASLDADASDTGGPPPHEPPGLSFPGATGYFYVPASDALEIAVVRATDGTCNTPRARQRVPIDPGMRTTVALMGLAQADAGTAEALALVPFVDDPTPAAGTTRTRFVHAALGTAKSRGPGPLAVEATSQSAVTELSARVEPGHASSPSQVAPVVDVRGYHDGPTMTSGAIHLAEIGDGGFGDSGAVSWISAVGALDLREGATHTGFIVSTGARELAIAWCDDGAPAASCVVLRP